MHFRLIVFLQFFYIAGCGQNITQFESKSKVEQNALAEESNRTLVSTTSTTPSITLTKAAASQIMNHFQADRLEQQYLFVNVKTGGCSGFQYELMIKEIADTSEYEIFTSLEIPIAIPHSSFVYLKGTRLDYITDETGRIGFHFDNPNVIRKEISKD